MARLLRVALTGGIATGKSRCLTGFAALGVPTVDADRLAREAVEPGSPGLAAIVVRYGSPMLNPNGELDREALGRLVFSNPDARRDLEHIVHPFVYRAIEEWLDDQWRRGASMAIADVPLLFETNRQEDFDRVIVTSCTVAQQFERLMARGTMSEIEARQRIAAHLPTEVKVLGADFVIDTSGTLAETDAQIAKIYEELLQFGR